MSNQVGRLYVLFDADGKPYIKGLKDLDSATQQHGRKMQSDWEKFGDKAGQAVKRGMQVAALAVAAAGAAMTVATVKAAASFEYEMSRIRAVSGATGAEMQKLTTLTLQLGKDTVFSAGEAAQAITELAKAGVSVGDILGGAASGTLALASAGELEVARAAEIAANAMNMFGIAGKDVMTVADALASAANASSLEVNDLAEAFKFIGPVANQLDIPFQQVIALIAELGNQGIKGEQAGTGLRTMLLSLAAPSKIATDAMDAYGVSAYDAFGNIKPMPELLDHLQQKLQGLTQQEQIGLLEKIFGREGASAALILIGQGSAALETMQTTVSKVGEAGRVAATKMDNLKGSWEQLRGSLETAAIQIGTPLLADIREVVDQMTAAVNEGLETGDWSKVTDTLAGVFAGAIQQAVETLGPIVVEMTPKIVWGGVKATAEGLFDWGQQIRIDSRYEEIEKYLTLHPGISFEDALKELENPSTLGAAFKDATERFFTFGIEDWTGGDTLKVKLARLELGFTDISLNEADVRAAIEGGYPAEKIAALLKEQQVKVTQKLIEGGTPDFAAALFTPGEDLTAKYADLTGATDYLAASMANLPPVVNETTDALGDDAAATEWLKSATEALSGIYGNIVSPADAWATAIEETGTAADIASGKYDKAKQTFKAYLDEMNNQIANWTNFEDSMKKIAAEWGPKYGAELMIYAAEQGPDVIAEFMGLDDATQAKVMAAWSTAMNQNFETLAAEIAAASSGAGADAGAQAGLAWAKAFAANAHVQFEQTGTSAYATLFAHSEGAYVTRPELALIGEDGPELVLPLTKPDRMAALMKQAGLDDYSGDMSADFSGGSGPVLVRDDALANLLRSGALVDPFVGALSDVATLASGAADIGSWAAASLASMVAGVDESWAAMMDRNTPAQLSGIGGLASTKNAFGGTYSDGMGGIIDVPGGTRESALAETNSLDAVETATGISAEMDQLSVASLDGVLAELESIGNEIRIIEQHTGLLVQTFAPGAAIVSAPTSGAVGGQADTLDVYVHSDGTPAGDATVEAIVDKVEQRIARNQRASVNSIGRPRR